MTTLPKGITPVTYTLKSGQQAIKYRVRKRTKDTNITRLFDTLAEALEFKQLLSNTVSQDVVKAEELLRNSKEQEAILNAFIEEHTQNPTISILIAIYKKDYLKEKDDREISVLNLKSEKYRLNSIEDTSIEITADPLKNGVFSVFSTKEYKKFGDFKIKEINQDIVKGYIKARIELGKARGTIQKELTSLSNFFYAVQDILKISFPNPVIGASRRMLVKAKSTKKSRYMSEEETKEIQEKLNEKGNLQLLQIVMLANFTSLRRSEIIELKWYQIHDTYVVIENSKNGEEREVWLNSEARELIKTIEKKSNQDRLFTYTIEGFKTAWQRFRAKLPNQNIKFHDFRKRFITDTIQKQIEVSGIASVFGLGQALGVQDLDHFKRTYVDREQAKHNHRMREKGIQTEEELRQNSAHKDYKTQQIYVTKLSKPK